AVDPLRHSLARRLVPLEVPLGKRVEEVTLFEGRLPGGLVTAYLLDHPLFDRDGVYGEGGADYADNARRFGLLGRAALELVHKLDRWPDVIHAHDWQGGLALGYVATDAIPGRPRPATVFTIHNLAFQGPAPRAYLEDLGLPWSLFTPEAGGCFGQLTQLKLGAALAERVTTVSPRYAREIQTPERGAGLEGFLARHAGKLVGILNGIDTETWDPARDPFLPARFDADDRSGKMACKAALQRELGLPVRAGVPLFGMVSRLTEQKGYKLLLEAGEELARLDAQWIFLGRGERRFEDGLANLVRRYPARFGLRVAQDDALAHRIEAGADFFLMPSSFEPCGLNQMYSQRYGTVPIVRATGGLDDTVVDYDETTRTGTGFKFGPEKADALVATLKRALALYKRKDAFDALGAQIMRPDHGWHRSARRYLELYERLAAERRAA